MCLNTNITNNNIINRILCIYVCIIYLKCCISDIIKQTMNATK